MKFVLSLFFPPSSAQPHSSLPPPTPCSSLPRRRPSSSSFAPILCLKKRIPQALEIFHQMNDKGCHPDVATYNLLIKHLCKIQRMEKVYELFNEMGQKGESCLPNIRTYEVFEIMEKMEPSVCKMTGDTYNLVLGLFMGWDHEEKVKYIWKEMEKGGLQPDRRSYTIMVHGLYDKGRMKEAMPYFQEMTLKGMTLTSSRMTRKMNKKQ